MVNDCTLEELETEFKKFLHEHRDIIDRITEVNPVISKDDEWNDPIYDNYAAIDIEPVTD